MVYKGKSTLIPEGLQRLTASTALFGCHSIKSPGIRTGSTSERFEKAWTTDSNRYVQLSSQGRVCQCDRYSSESLSF